MNPDWNIQQIAGYLVTNLHQKALHINGYAAAS
jgi:hypothetical protein